MKSIYLISGEVSGDTHGSELMHAIADELGGQDKVIKALPMV